MRYVTCGICLHDKTPLNSSLQIDSIVYCENCLKENFKAEDALKGRNVVKEFDPTVCFSCSKDFGDFPLKRHGGYPVCDACSAVLQERIFPRWVKVFFAGVILLVIFSFTWNWRFIRAYYLIKNSGAAIQSQNFAEASDTYQQLSASVPEIGDFTSLAAYYRGVAALHNDKSAEALREFKKCAQLPDGYHLDVYILQAEIGASFDTKDYTRFIETTKSYLMYDTSSVSLAQVASAYACLYAVQKTDSLKEKAHQFLARARSANDTTKFFAEYVNRIEHRITTGDIITREEFEKKFPQGWTNH